MDPKFRPFINFTEDDYSPESPQISFELKAQVKNSTSLSTTLPYTLITTLRRLDTYPKAIIFRYSQYENFKRCRYTLLHETSSGLEKVDVPELPSYTITDDEPDTMLFNGHNNGIETLAANGEWWQGGEVMANYQQALTPGEKYHFFWPGAELEMWEWGGKREWMGKELKTQAVRETKVPRLVLPASNILSFTAREEKEPWPDRWKFERLQSESFASINRREAEWRRKKYPPPQPPPLGPESRVPGAPILTMKFEGPSEVNLTEKLKIKITVTYEGTGNPRQTAKPITFHTIIFTCFPSPGQLLRRRGKKWEICESENSSGCGFMIVDEPDIHTLVGSSPYFISLAQGEEWCTETTIHEPGSWTMFPEDTKIGDMFRFWCRGMEVDWWDWGVKEEHLETEVLLPCFVHGSITTKEGEKKNGGRDKVVVTKSNIVEFVVAGLG